MGGTHTDDFYDSGGGTTLMTLDGTRGLDFGSRLGQHLSLWGSDGARRFGIGMQAETLYARTGNGAGDGFAWYKGGAHNDGHSNPGGGTTLMTLDEESGLALNGNTTQAPGKLGLVKAMVYVNGDGTILRCYNGITGSSSGDCGFTVGRASPSGGWYIVTFPFQITDRFWVATVTATCCKGVTVNVDPDTGSLASNSVYLRVHDSDGNSTDRPVMMIVY